MELKELTFLTSDCTTKLQPPGEYSVGTKTEIETNGMTEKAQRETQTLMGALTKEPRIYNGEKTASSISGAGKTEQLRAKE